MRRKLTITNMEKCRACLATDVSLYPIDEDFINNYNILTNLDVKTSDNMPQSVCDTCFQSVKFFIDFREKCIVSEASLRSIKEDIKVESKQDILQNIKIEYDMDCEDSYLNPVDFTNDLNMLIIKHDLEDTKKVKKRYNRTKWKGTKKVLKNYEENCENQLFCGLCPKEFLDKTKLIGHLEEHRTSKNCYLCPQILKGWAHLLGHRVVHVPKDQKTCHLCSKRFLTAAGLEFHFRKVHLNEKNVILNCDMCTHTFDTPRKLHKHIWSMHSNINYVCDYCGKIYSNKHTLRVHIRTHMEIKLYVCNMCDFSCKHSGGLKDHKIRKHIAKKVYCAECKRVFENQVKCDQHKCSTKPPTICTVCGVELKRGVRLSRHMETHKAVGRYKCSRCPKAYKARGALEIHMNQHEGNRNLRCEFCPATFYYPSVLGKHRRIHTGEKPYVCKICNRGFTGNHNLKVHMKVHGEHNLIVKKVKPEIIEA